MMVDRIAPGMLGISQPAAEVIGHFLYSHEQQSRVSVADSATGLVVVRQALAASISKPVVSQGPIEPVDADIA